MVCNWRKAFLYGVVALLIPVKSEDIDECKVGEWRCGDRSCAGVGATCDGALHCDDGSDEALLLCRGTKRPLLGLLLLCLEPWAPMHAAVCPEACRRWPDYCHYALSAENGEPGTCIFPPFPSLGDYSITDIELRGAGPADFSLAYSCPAGYRQLGKNPRCVGGVWSGGFPSCIPASNSGVSADGGEIHGCSAQLFPCADGACVRWEQRCNGALDCADGSDERTCSADPSSELCVLPEYPKHGSYSVLDRRFVRPGHYISSASLIVSCDDDYELLGSSFLNCFYGVWSNKNMPLCSQCGTPTPEGDQLIINGVSTKHGELPWHAGIYDKTYTPLMQICGGSLVSSTVVISAAHCFWTDAEKLLSPSRYAVALGKIYRPWDDPQDKDTQKSDVSSIKIPLRFMGDAGHYQDDIALVFLTTPIVFTKFIRPVCIGFDMEFDKMQLKPGSMGKVSGWGLTSVDGASSQVLLTTELPYVDPRKCIADSPFEFRMYIASDKICAGTLTGTALCKGDSGGGLAFPTVDGRGTQRYYLRGVVSTAPRNGHKCNANTYTSFTHIQKHDKFIEEYVFIKIEAGTHLATLAK